MTKRIPVLSLSPTLITLSVKLSYFNFHLLLVVYLFFLLSRMILSRTLAVSLLKMSSGKLSSSSFSARAQSTAADPAPSIPQFKTLQVAVPKPFVFHVELNRPEKLNAMSHEMWMEIGDCFSMLNRNEDCRVILLTGKGRAFTSGIDFSSLARIGQKLADVEDVARRCKIVREMIDAYQESLSSLEKCSKPVIALINGPCIGGGVDLALAADIRHCSEDAIFQVKEVDIGMAADVGTLQRLQKVIGSRSLVNELCFTARQVFSAEAKECGLVSKIFKDRESMLIAGLQMAEDISAKSPVAVQVTKKSLVFSRDHSVQEGLHHIGDLNMTMLQSEDFMNASVAQATKSPPPVFAKL